MLIYMFYFVGECGYGFRIVVCKMVSFIIKILYYVLYYRL